MTSDESKSPGELFQEGSQTRQELNNGREAAQWYFEQIEDYDELRVLRDTAERIISSVGVNDRLPEAAIITWCKIASITDTALASRPFLVGFAARATEILRIEDE